LTSEFSSPPTYWTGLLTLIRSGSRRANTDSALLLDTSAGYRPPLEFWVACVWMCTFWSRPTASMLANRDDPP